MNAPNLQRLEHLLQSLGTEVVLAQPDSDQGLLPMLDLLGNLRDESVDSPPLAAFHARVAAAWEDLVTLIESGQRPDAEQVKGLGRTFTELERLLENSQTETGPPCNSPTPRESVEVEEGPLVLALDGDTDLLREFIGESREHLDNIEAGALVLEEHPADAETLNTVFRAFHTFKGGAGFLNLIPINRLAHGLESLLDLARQHRLTIDSELIELILRGRDTLKQFVDEIEAQLDGRVPPALITIPIGALRASVTSVVDAHTGAAPATAPVTADEPVPAQRPVSLPEFPSTEASATADETSTGREAPSAAHPGNESPATQAPKRETAPPPAAVPTDTTVKVKTQRLDNLVDLVGELVIAQSQVMEGLNSLAETDPQSARTIAQMGRITRELQRVSLSMRMVPIRGSFQKMTRVVRDLGAKQGKSIELVLTGEDTELDRNVVEALNDPLLHMVRNSVDHGVESATTRQAAGKPAVATIHLRAYHQGGNIVVEIEDDGAGLNRERILAKAVERGLATPNTSHSDHEVYQLIFAPGFSTAEKITDISGRGVGLDVVHRNIEKLHGQVDISSTPGQGTLFRLFLPLTLAIIDGLIVKVGQERLIIPTLSVCEAFRPTPDMLTTVQGRGEVLNVRGKLVPLVRLGDVFGLPVVSRDPTQGLVVVVQAGVATRALLVDSLVNKQEVVIKNLGEVLQRRTSVLAGAAILGDGQAALIIDINALVNNRYGQQAKAA